MIYSGILGLITLWIAAIITLLSGYNYMIKGMKHI
jgi:phosphatidylglycerophosphate synthase